MEIKTVLFDLDGTLLPMDQDEFIKVYFKSLAAKLAPLGYEPKKLIDSIWAGTKAMITNDGSCQNEEAFWRVFEQIHGHEAMKDKPTIDAFYNQEFINAKTVCGFEPMAKQIVDTLRAAGKTVVLATNPIFPAIATENRIRWAGLTPEDFVLYTTYENSRFCKPNPRYYEDILLQLGCAPEECLMIGNDAAEDMVAETLGMKVFLLTDCLINKDGRDLSTYPQGDFAALRDFIAGL